MNSAPISPGFRLQRLRLQICDLDGLNHKNKQVMSIVNEQVKVNNCTIKVGKNNIVHSLELYKLHANFKGA